MTIATDLTKIKNHLALTGSSSVAELMLPQLLKHGIKTFNFHREYTDGSIIRLSSDAVWNEHYFNKGYINKRDKAPSSLFERKDNYYLWTPKYWPEMLIDAAVNFDTANGITYAERGEGYVDFFGFGAKANNISILNFYINHLDLLKNYSHDFRDKAAALISLYEKDKIIMGAESPAKIASYSPIPSHNLSSRQLQCANLLMQGKTYKEVASVLDISVRTVETHFETLRIKLSCRNKSELIVKLPAILNVNVEQRKE